MVLRLPKSKLRLRSSRLKLLPQPLLQRRTDVLLEPLLHLVLLAPRRSAHNLPGTKLCPCPQPEVTSKSQERMACTLSGQSLVLPMALLPCLLWKDDKALVQSRGKGQLRPQFALSSSLSSKDNSSSGSSEELVKSGWEPR